MLKKLVFFLGGMSLLYILYKNSDTGRTSTIILINHQKAIVTVGGGSSDCNGGLTR